MNMNVFSYVLERDAVSSSPQLSRCKFVIEDNIGESIHIHYRNLRLEMTVEDFDSFADGVKTAAKELDNGNN